MKTPIVALLVVATTLLFAGCNKKQSAEASHTHTESCSHDADEHDHDADDHDHDHAGKAGHEGHEDHDHGHSHDGEIAFSHAQAEAVGLQTETVAPRAFSSVIKTGGRIQAPQGNEQTVAATASGLVSFANSSITEGTAVSAGEVIANIASQGLQDGDATAKARIAYEAAKREYERAERLVADKIISQKEYEAARAAYETARASYQGIAASAGAKGVSVKAGMGGYIKQLLVGQGEYVAVGQPIAVISQSKRLQLRADVPESRYSQLGSIADANFKSAYDGTKVYRLADLGGRLVSTSRSAAGGSAFIPVVFEFDNVGDVIPGSYAEVYLKTTPREGVLTLPVSALTEEQGLYFVYVKTEPDAYVKRSVKPGQSDGERVEIVSGIVPGDEVVTQGAVNVKLASGSGEIPHGHQH
jgi:RND family efflux transporter MFP subunit